MIKRAIIAILNHILQLVFVGSAVLALTLVWLQTPPGSQWLLARLVSYANSVQSGVVINAKGLGVGWPFRLALDELTLADAEGAWLELHGLRALWNPLALADNLLDVSSLKLARAQVHRYPAGNTETASTDEPAHLPLLELASAQIGELRLPGIPYAITSRLRASGPLDKPMLTFSALEMPEIALAAHGELDTAGRPLPAGQLAFTLTQLEKLSPALAGDLTGAVVLQDSRVTLTASSETLRANGQKLAPLTLQAPVTIDDGKVNGTAALSAQYEGEALTADTRFAVADGVVTIDDLTVRSSFAAAQASLTYQTADGALQGKAALDVPDLAAPGRLLGQELAGSLKAAATARSTAGGYAVNWQGSTALTLPLVTTATATGAVRLENGLTTLQVSALSATYGDAVIDASGSLHGQEVDAKASWRGFMAPGWERLGPSSGTLRLTGTLANPQLDGTLELAPQEPQPGLLKAVLAYANGAATLEATYSQKNQRLLSAQAKATHTLNLLLPDVPGWLNAPLEGSATGRIELDWLAAQDMVEMPLRQGTLSLDLRLAGRVQQPLLSGTAGLAGGLYQSPATGTELHDITARARFSGAALQLEELAATDGRTGRLRGSGSLTPTAISLALEADDFLALRLPEATARASARVQLTGAALDALTLAGRIDVQEALLRIPERLPVSLIRLPVTQLGQAPRQPLETAPESTPFTLALDLAVEARNQIRLEGRGLQSELAGQFAIRGTTAAPDMTGYLELVRGSFDFLGKRLRLTSGRVSFDGGKLGNPTLNLLATQQSTGLTTTVKVGGTAQQPEISYSSTPELPQDEIIARLLFGRSAKELSPLQAVQLASAIASVASGDTGFDLTGRLRRGLGLDELDVVSDDSASADSNLPGGALEMGKYLSDDVYISTRQGLTPESRSVGVELRLSPTLSLQSETNAESAGNVNLRYQRDY